MVKTVLIYGQKIKNKKNKKLVNDYYLLLNQGFSNSAVNKKKSKTTEQVLNIWSNQTKNKLSKE